MTRSRFTRSVALAAVVAALCAALGVAMARTLTPPPAPTPPSPSAPPRPTAYPSPSFVINDPAPPDAQCTMDAYREILAAMGGIDPSALTGADPNTILLSLPRPYSCASLTEAQWRAVLFGS